MSERRPTKVAIACQGGGSHTAFTAGVLERLLADDGGEYDVVGLTGTSGGAMCAFLAWYGLRTGDEEKATRLLEGFWNDLSASSLPERAANDAFVFSMKLLSNGYPVWQPSPSANPLAKESQQWLRHQLEKRLDAASVEELVGETTAQGSRARPKLVVSAVDATDGSFGVFTDDLQPAANGGVRSGGTPTGTAGDESVAAPAESRKPFEEDPKPLTLDAVLASAAVPPLFDAVEMPDPDGTVHEYWDGLLSQNPPIRNLLTGTEAAERKPDEIWLVRINPTRHQGPLDTLENVEDRRNELAGSLSLQQELHFIDQVNTWLRAGVFSEAAAERYKEVTVRAIDLDEDRLSPPRRLVTSTKLDRDPRFIDGLVALGEQQASEFLTAKTSDQFVVVE